LLKTGLSFKGKSLSFKGKKIDEGWVGIFTNYGFSSTSFFSGHIFFMGMLIHSSFMHEYKKNLKRDSKKALVLSMTTGVRIVGWMFLYGYYVNSL
jgi:hypothetical protein